MRTIQPLKLPAANSRVSSGSQEKLFATSGGELISNKIRKGKVAIKKG